MSKHRYKTYSRFCNKQNIMLTYLRFEGKFDTISFPQCGILCLIVFCRLILSAASAAQPPNKSNFSAVRELLP